MELLYVDDEPSLLELGKEFLELEPDVSVTTQTNPVDALTILNDKHFDIIISDYMMPEMDGLEFFKRLRISGIVTPFILFTGKGREEVVIEAMRHGVDFYIKKGGDAKSQFAELINAIRQCTARREAEEALEHNARRFRTMIENQSEIIALSDLKGNFKYISTSLKRILGYEPDELIGKNVASIFVDPSIFTSVSQPGTHPNLSFRIEADMKHKDGSARCMEMTGRILMKNGLPHEVVVNAYDITGRRQDERRIRHLISVQKAIRQVNKSITSETEPLTLLKDVCDIAVERGYSTSWGVIFDDGRNPNRMVETGIGLAFEKVQAMFISGERPTCTSHILSGTDTFVNEDPQVVCPNCPLNSPHDHVHVAKLLAYGGHTFGQLSVTLPRELFSPEELSVVGEISEDLSFALHHLTLGQEKEEYHLSKVNMKKQFQDRFTHLNSPTFVVDRQATDEGAEYRLILDGASIVFLDAMGFDPGIIGMDVSALAENGPDGSELSQIIDDVARTRIPQSVPVRSACNGSDYLAFIFSPGSDYTGVMLIPSVKAERSLCIGRGV